MTPDPFREYGEYYDLLYRDKDYAGEVAYVTETLRHHGAASTILELGAGTGRHGALLAERGFRVVGIERSPSMLAAARRASAGLLPSGPGRFECEEGDIRTIRLPQKFDAVIALFHVVSYQVTNDDLARTFATAAHHLRPAGVFLFDLWHGPAVLRERPAVRMKYLEDERSRLWRVAEPSVDTQTGTVTVGYTILVSSKADARLSTVHEEHRMRYLFPTEIDMLAANAGLRIERCEEPVTGRPPSDATWGVAYVLRKLA
jgi:SAM-dependent methyltransferase